MIVCLQMLTSAQMAQTPVTKMQNAPTLRVASNATVKQDLKEMALSAKVNHYGPNCKVIN